jgi:hypothetical protein
MENSQKYPEWLNKNFLRQALSSYETNQPVEVLDFKINKNFSQHYGSSMFQCQIDYKSEKSESDSLQVVIKAAPLDDELKMKISGHCMDFVFNNETQMYRETIPAIKRLFELHDFKVNFAPE